MRQDFEKIVVLNLRFISNDYFISTLSLPVTEQKFSYNSIMETMRNEEIQQAVDNLYQDVEKQMI
jgi:hypothetical protein